MTDDRKKPLWPWIVALLAALMVLYVVSSGPMRRVISDHSHETIQYFDPRTGRQVVSPFDFIEWLDRAYQPLYWVSEYAWAKPLHWYWDLFPIPAYY